MMSYTYKSASQAVSYARSVSRWAVAMCLNFVWHCLDYPRSAGLQNANQSWTAATMKRYTGTPPAGAPVYWRSGKYGHIAISLGNGWCRSTDWPSKGYVGNVLISRLSAAWGATYRGWSADYAGHPIPGLGTNYPGTQSVDMTSPIYAHNLRPGYRNNDVKRFELAMWNALGGPYRASVNANAANAGAVTDGFYGDLTKAMCSDSYAKYGMSRATYPGGTALLKALGFKDARV